MRRDEQIFKVASDEKTFVKDPAFTASLAYPAIMQEGRSLAADVDDMPNGLQHTVSDHFLDAMQRPL